MKVSITGKPQKISREEARAWIYATLCVLEYHNKPLTRPIAISFVARLHNAGVWYPSGRIKIQNWLEPDETFTTLVHELIHECCGDFEEDSDEKCTSTLTARMKAQIAPIAQMLLDGTYQRAAWLAHTKIAYRTKPDPKTGLRVDHYDDDQNRPVGWRGRFRRKKHVGIRANQR